jgi:spore germination cell wall hydrolase CwlJ-like protein
MVNSIPTYSKTDPLKWEIIETTPIEPNPVELVKNEVRYTANWDADTSDNTIEVSYADAQLLMKVAQAEGGNQGIIGMQRIMEVILNRVESDEFPNSIQEVVYQPGQFETVTQGIIYTVEISPECHQALAEVEKNLQRNKEIIAFETSVNGRSLERYFDYLYSVQDHDFYTTKKN